MFTLSINKYRDIVTSLEEEWKEEVDNYPPECTGDDLASARFYYEQALEMVERLFVGNPEGAAWIYYTALNDDPGGYSRPQEWLGKILRIGREIKANEHTPVPQVGDWLPSYRTANGVEYVTPEFWEFDEENENLIKRQGAEKTYIALVEEGRVKAVYEEKEERNA